MKKILATIISAIAVFSLSASAETINFDGLSTVQTDAVAEMPTGYAGLTWNNFYLMNPSLFTSSGYVNGVVSPTNVAFNWYGDAASFSKDSPFTLNSGFFTGAWNDDLTIMVTGYGINNYEKTFVVNTGAPTNVVFNWTGLSSVSFVSLSGVHNDSYDEYGEQFALDNLVLDDAISVPEPTTLLIIALGMLGLGFIRKRSAK